MGTALLPFHIVAGLGGIATGAIALVALKGGRAHRRAGMWFVYAMLFMSSSGALIAALKPHGWGTALEGFFTFYLVASGLLAIRRRQDDSRRLDLVALLVAVTLGVTYFTFGIEALRSQTGRKDGYPAMLYFIFGTVTWLAAFGDLRVLARGIQGRRQLARHLWRMSLAMFIATASLFLGQAKVFPKPIRIMPLLSIPALLVLGVMLYWLVRLRLKGSPRLFKSSGPTTPPIGVATALSVAGPSSV